MPRRGGKSLSTERFAELLLAALIAILLLARIPIGGGAGGDRPASDLTLRLDLNRAAWHELTCLPGIGEVRAKEIVTDRRVRGPFEGPEDLDRVKGIGPVTVRKVREFTRQEPPGEGQAGE
ncbi:MAG: helix-hairpin-helix domain-containing protein [Planctomycetota bacterium]